MRASDALGAAVDALTAAGCDTPRLDAEVLIADAMGVERGSLVADPGQEIVPAAARLVGERVRRRIQREPVAYILGRKGFRFVELAVDRRVLIPRPETELLVELALALPPGSAVHDVGTGSGAVALALASERPDLRVSASEASADAVVVARANAARLGLDVEVAHEAGLPAGTYDLVVANLPYVAEDEYRRLAPEIQAFEPRAALAVRRRRPRRHPRAGGRRALGHPAGAGARDRPGRGRAHAAGRRRDPPRPGRARARDGG